MGSVETLIETTVEGEVLFPYIELGGGNELWPERSVSVTIESLLLDALKRSTEISGKMFIDKLWWKIRHATKLLLSSTKQQFFSIQLSETSYLSVLSLCQRSLL